MKSNIVKTHPLAEILARKLFGISTVPPAEQKKMVSRAIKAAVEWAEENYVKQKCEKTKIQAGS